MITISKDQKDAIKDICKLPKPNAAQEVLRNVYLLAENGTLTLKATNLTVELTKTIPVNLESSFEATVNASKFMQAVNASNGDIKLIVSDKDIQIKSGRRKFTLPTISAEAYFAYPDQENAKQLEINSFSFVQSVKAVMFAAGDGSVVPHVLNGICVRDRFYGAMNAKMAWLDSGLDCDFILPRESVQYMPELDGGVVHAGDNILSITFDDFEFKTILIDGKYSDVSRLIPNFSKSIKLNKAQFIDAVKAAMITANEKSKSVIIKFGAESFIKSTNNSESASIEFDCDTTEDFEVGFNSSYLLDALNALSSETITIEYEDALKQVVFRDETFQSLIMPVRL